MARTATKLVADQERRGAMLRAAADVFFEEGYSAASIDTVIAKVGGSKRTIYNEFGSKEGLFHALIAELADEANAVLSRQSPSSHDVTEQLTDFGIRMLALQMSPRMLGAYRASIAEARRFPELARGFYEKLPGFAAARLSKILERAQAEGQIKVTDCHAAASQFIGMGRDNLHLEVVLGLRPPLTPKQIRKTVKRLVDTFIDGVGLTRSKANSPDRPAEPVPGRRR